MSNRNRKRQMTDAERLYLERLLRNAPTEWRRWKEGAENALVLWAAGMLLIFVVSLAISWLGKTIFHTVIADTGFWVLGVSIPGCAVWAIVSSVRWVRKWPDNRDDLRADLQAGLVSEEYHQFDAAKRFEELEHGGMIYFLRTIKNKVFVLYDRESQELGIDGQDPLSSSFCPRAELLVVRAPRSRFVISREFSGGMLDAGLPRALALEPDHWPEHEAYCKVPWPELDAHFSEVRK